MILENKTLSLARAGASHEEPPGGHAALRRAHDVGSYSEAASQVASTTTTTTLQLLAAEKHLAKEKEKSDNAEHTSCWYFLFLCQSTDG